MHPRDVQLMVHRMVARMPPEVRRSVTPHGLRHTAGTLLLLSGAADPATVRDLFGHSNLSTTSAYLDTEKAQLIQAVRQHPVTAHRG
jgi:site-specific recombinase XerD